VSAQVPQEMQESEILYAILLPPIGVIHNAAAAKVLQCRESSGSVVTLYILLCTSYNTGFLLVKSNKSLVYLPFQAASAKMHKAAPKGHNMVLLPDFDGLLTFGSQRSGVLNICDLWYNQI